LIDGPILHVDDDPRLEGNVNGPSLIAVPSWVPHPLGRYYLYFAHHEGRSIRLAYADALTGPWTLHEPGALQLADSGFPTTAPTPDTVHPHVQRLFAAGMDRLYPHIASPDMIVDAAHREIRMYYHGRLEDGTQMTRVAVSRDGLHFTPRQEILGNPYFRVFHHEDTWYALAMPGLVYRSHNGLTDFVRGPTLFNPDMRHSALLKRGTTLYVFWTQAGDTPERILVSSIDLSADWRSWCDSELAEVRRATRSWEGADLPVEPSRRGAIMHPVNQLRDPAIFLEDDCIYLLYAVAGEQGIAVGRLTGLSRKARP
jgi:hypothetical protein